MNLSKGFHDLIYIPTVRGLLGKMQGFLLRDQGQETQHLPPHGAVCYLTADDLDSSIHLVKITERDYPSEGFHEDVCAALYYLCDLTDNIACFTQGI